jgi:hypothetical protein
LIFCWLCIAVGALALAASASARTPHHPATLFFDGSDSVDDTTFVVGHLTSPSQKCLSKRTTKISYDSGTGSFEPVDVVKSSANGSFAGAGPASEKGHIAERAKFKLVEKTFTQRGRRHVCEGAGLVIN